MPNTLIDRVGSYMPDEWLVSNEEFIERYVRERPGRIYSYDGAELKWKHMTFSAEWILKMTGIEQRYFSPSGINISKINSMSVEKLIAGDDTYRGSIVGVINAGVTGPGNFMTFPAHAAMIQKEALLQDIKWAFDVATHERSYETAKDIAFSLNSQQPGVYVGVFAKTREDVAHPTFNTKAFGKVIGIEIYDNGKSITDFDKLPLDMKAPELMENVEWQGNDGDVVINNDYIRVASIIRDALAESHITPYQVKGVFVINQTQKGMPLFRTNAYEIAQYNALNNLKWCFDIAAACASTQLEFAIGDGLHPLASDGKRIIASVGEQLDRIIDLEYADEPDANNVLFGTASAAFGISRSHDNKGFIYFDGINDPFLNVGGSGPLDYKHRWIFKSPQGFIMMPEGSKVFKEAVNGLSGMMVDMIRSLDWQDSSDLEMHTHNANIRIFAGIGDYFKRAEITGNIVKNIDKVANASAGSCAKMKADRFPYISGKKIVDGSLGAGVQKCIAAYQG